ncbi:MinD/ParA family ATP-binding protein [Rathayibacter toxicus]|nr:MinD/ParA family protein [Rathayibacter toxicus]
MDERNDQQTDTGPAPRTAANAARDSVHSASRISDTAPHSIPDGVRVIPPAVPPRRSNMAASAADQDAPRVSRPGLPNSRSNVPLPSADSSGPIRPVAAGIAARGEVSVLPDDVGQRPRGRGEHSHHQHVESEAGRGTTRRDRLRAESNGPSTVGSSPESSSMLTSDRLLEVNRKTRPAPTGGWNRVLYGLTFHTVNRGDSARVRAWKEMDERIGRQFEGGTRFVPVLTRKGGVGKTTVTALLGMALADSREDRIIAVDANPDRGTLAERVPKQTRATVRDVVRRAAAVTGFTDFSTLVSRDETRLDVLASDTDPQLSEAFDENDYNVVADLIERFYSIMLTDCGTGIVHSVMRATLQRADTVVIVTGGSVDEARLASETLTWLDANGYGELVRNAVVALNTASQGTSLVKLDEIESHFRSRVRDIVRVPYDPVLAAGSVVKWEQLRQSTKEAARLLAALVVEGMPVRRV